MRDTGGIKSFKSAFILFVIPAIRARDNFLLILLLILALITATPLAVEAQGKHNDRPSIQ